MNGSASAIKIVVVVCVVLFVIPYLVPGLKVGMFESLALYYPANDKFRFWQFVTNIFMHGGFMHIFFNMFALFMFGSDIERLFGPRRYLIYYLACVVGAALMHLIVVSVAGLPPGPVVGASGGVFGILLAFGMAFPHRKLIMLPIPIPISAWLFVTLYALLEMYMGVTQTSQGVAHFAHLGGMATGFVLIRYWTARNRRR